MTATPAVPGVVLHLPPPSPSKMSQQLWSSEGSCSYPRPRHPQERSMWLSSWESIHTRNPESWAGFPREVVSAPLPESARR